MYRHKNYREEIVFFIHIIPTMQQIPESVFLSDGEKSSQPMSSVRLPAMYQTPSTKKETKNGSTAHCCLPDVPDFHEPRNLRNNILVNTREGSWSAMLNILEHNKAHS